MDSEEYSITWNEHPRNVVDVFGRFWEEGALVDCTIAAEGECLKAHRLMLSACSPYFELQFSQEMKKDKILVLENIAYEELKSLIAFMYQGQVTVSKNRLRNFVRAAEFLQIKGLPKGLVHNAPETSEGDVEDTRIWESEDESTSAVTAGEKNRNKSTPVQGIISSSYSSVTSPVIPENESTRSLPKFSSVTASTPSSVDTACTSPFVPNIPTEQSDSAVVDPSSCVETELAEQSACVKNEPDVKSEVIPAVFPLPSESTVEPMHAVWVREMRSWESEEVRNAADTSVSCSQRTTNQNLDVAGATASDSSHPVVWPKVTFRDVKIEEPDVNEQCREEDCESINSSDSEDKMGEEEQETMLGTMEEEEEDAVLEESSHKCLRCPEVFHTVSGLKEHVDKQHRKERTYRCQECMSAFACRSKLQAHMRKHTGERPFQCEVCQWSFSDKGNLTVHRRRHTGERPFQCEVCNKTFSHMYNLTVHKRKHTGERPFPCDFCPMSFSHKSSLTIHKRTHTGERPFQCDVCTMSFSRGAQLTVHKRKHTGERPFQCDVCGRPFSQKCHLIKHMRTHPAENIV